MKKVMLSVLATSLIFGGTTVASATEASNSSQKSVEQKNSVQSFVARAAWTQTINGPVKQFIATGSDPVTVIKKFELKSNKKVTIHGWQESTANGKAPAIEYQLVDTATNRVVQTISLNSEYKKDGTWFNKQFNMTGLTVPKHYEVRAKNTSSYGVTLGMDLYVDFN